MLFWRGGQKSRGLLILLMRSHQNRREPPKASNQKPNHHKGNHTKNQKLLKPWKLKPTLTCMYVCMYVCVCVCMYVRRTYVRMYVCMYVLYVCTDCMYVCMYVHTCAHQCASARCVSMPTTSPKVFSSLGHVCPEQAGADHVDSAHPGQSKLTLSLRRWVEHLKHFLSRFSRPLQNATIADWTRPFNMHTAATPPAQSRWATTLKRMHLRSFITPHARKI